MLSECDYEVRYIIRDNNIFAGLELDKLHY